MTLAKYAHPYYNTMDDHAYKTLQIISRKLQDEFPTDLEGFYAFGSRVRGDHHEESDFDLLVVVTDRTPAKINRIIDIIVDTEMEHNLSFFPVIKDTSAFEKEKQYNTPFYHNIMEEGIAL